jgi:hypothetical protein
VRKAFAGGEYGTRVADGDLVAEKGSDRGDGGGPEMIVALATGRWPATASLIASSSASRPAGTGSTRTSMIPPQVSPTAKASSSLTP